MSTYIPEALIDEIEQLKELNKYDEAMQKINTILVKDPSNEDALLQVTDIQYRQWEIGKATKAIDFLNANKKNEDPLWLYIKWVLEMEKNNWLGAKQFLRKALELTNAENHEIIRCYGLCEYWYGNREKWVNLLKDSFSINNKDAEVIYNLIEIYILEQNYKKAKSMISYFYKNHKNIQTVDKEIDYYDNKIALFEKFITTQHMFTPLQAW